MNLHSFNKVLYPEGILASVPSGQNLFRGFFIQRIFHLKQENKS